MYEYEGKLATYYDYFVAGVEGDVDFYVEEARKAGGPVLELACGTGRVLVPTAQAGVEIGGLDISATMLSVARGKIGRLDKDTQKHVELAQGDMKMFDLGRRFKLITIPCRGFLHMMTPEDQRQCLACVREHLEDDGRLILNLFDPKLDISARDVGAPIQGAGDTEFTDPATGHRVVVSTTNCYTPETQRIDVEFLFEEMDDGKAVETSRCPFTLRWIYRYEMHHLLELCGFEIEALYGDFQRGPFKYGGEQIWVARKALKGS